MFGRVTDWHFHEHRTPARVSMDPHDGRNRSYLRVSSENCPTVHTVHTVCAVGCDLKPCTLVDTFQRIHSVLNGSFVTVPPCRTSWRRGTEVLGIEGIIAVVHGLCFSVTSTATGRLFCYVVRLTWFFFFFLPSRFHCTSHPHRPHGANRERLGSAPYSVISRMHNAFAWFVLQQ